MARAPAFGHRRPRNPQRHLRVLERRELGQQVVELKHEPDLPVAERHEVGIGQRRDLGAADDDPAVADPVQAAKDVQQGALPDS